jgi:Tol biopolymer transport system component
VADVVERLTSALADRYRIERELGAGGMATVYLAEDLRHQRKVALKVLRPELAAVLGAERFVQEITTTASLQHPHILPLFDSGTADGFLFYVMPYIQGETLRDRLNRDTQLGVEESLKIATEVADALDHAHRNGVIHRDIKPENILLADGRPMVADFGIALAVSAAAGGRMTETGLSLGTPHYMSPEQATADKEITARSDIYSLASVLYEMLTGEPPHMGNSAQQIIMKILTDVPRPVAELRKSVPPNVAAAIAKALEKLPADRFDSAKAFADALTNPAFTRIGTAATAIHAQPAARWKDRAALPLAVGLVLVAIIAAWGWLRPQPPVQTARLPILLPDDSPLEQQAGILFALTADGSEIVYTGPGDGNDVALWRRPLNALTATSVPGTNGADSPFLSPDGEVVAFYRGGPPALYTVTLRGGPRQTVVTDSTLQAGGDFGSDGSIYFVREDGIRRVDVEGHVEAVTSVDRDAGETSHRWVDLLPNEKGLLFTILRQGDDEQADIAVVDLDSREINVLVRGVYARYASTGHIVFSDAAGGLFAVPFDPDALRTTGTAIPIVAGVTRSGNGLAHFALSDNGTLLYGTGAGRVREELLWVDRAGSTTVIDSTITGPFLDLALSPDGRRLAFAQTDGNSTAVFTKELDQGPVDRLASEGDDWGPAWISGGEELMFIHSPESRVQDVYIRRADGSRSARLVLHSDDGLIDFAFPSRDGQWIVWQTDPAGRATGRDILARRMTGDTTTLVLAATGAAEMQPRLSPDGRWLAWVSGESGRPEVYVSPFPDAESSRVKVSLNGGLSPLWSRDGTELFYMRGEPGGDLMLIAAKVETSPGFRVVERTPLFDTTDYDWDITLGLMYDVSPDGQRFVMTRGQGASTEQLILVQNWFAELVGTGGR